MEEIHATCSMQYAVWKGTVIVLHLFYLFHVSQILNTVPCILAPVSLTSAQVRHIAKLARLTIHDDEVEKFAKELSAILDYIEKLKEVNTQGVEPTAQITGLSTVTRTDTVIERPATTEALLATSPLPIVDQQIETPSSLG